ncbi:MAG: CoA pyrophosphatase [Saprospirales bacterium]|nr:MAG: CoA pyrophosphatase [Saprospirales bacterium]
MDISLMQNIEKALKDSLPGHKAHMEMAVVGHHRKAEAPGKANKAGVLALFIPGENGCTELVFIRRSSHYHDDRHKGQIGFPGGKKERVDSDIRETALRETYEEIGVDPVEVEVLGKLSNLYIPVSNFLVYPFVGFVRSRPKFSLQETEIAEVITCDYKRLLNYDCRNTTKIELSNGIHLENVPYFDLKGKILWGATAMMMAELVHVLKRV